MGAVAATLFDFFGSFPWSVALGIPVSWGVQDLSGGRRLKRLCALWQQTTACVCEVFYCRHLCDNGVQLGAGGGRRVRSSRVAAGLHVAGMQERCTFWLGVCFPSQGCGCAQQEGAHPRVLAV
jgi:hypothetical protein